MNHETDDSRTAKSCWAVKKNSAKSNLTYCYCYTDTVYYGIGIRRSIPCVLYRYRRCEETISTAVVRVALQL